MCKSLSRLLKSKLSRPFLVVMPIVLFVLLIGASVPVTYAAPDTTRTDVSNSAFKNYWHLSGGNWAWGPALTGPVQEPFVEGADGQRLVQYFSKGRMEQNYPGGSITSGLLVLEMVSGKMQIGEKQVAPMSCAVSSPIAGDLNTLAPTYEDLGLVIDQGECKGITGSGCAEQYHVGAPVDNEIFVDGSTVYVRPNADLAANHVLVGKYDVVSGHNIPQVFADYMNKMDSRSQIGMPISEPYWVRDVKVDGVSRQVVIQAFERRILTYTGYDDGWRVQMSNTGEHYLLCRYGQYLTP